MSETRKLAANLAADVVGFSRLIEFRIGIHIGDVVEESVVDGVNIAARLEGIAQPGAICLSEDVYRQGSGPEFQQPSLLPIMSEASLHRPRAACRLG